MLLSSITTIFRPVIISTLTLSTSQIYNNNCTVSERVCLHDLRSDILQLVTNFLSVSQLIINNISAQLIFTDYSPVELSTKFRESFSNIQRKPYLGILLVESPYLYFHI